MLRPIRATGNGFPQRKIPDTLIYGVRDRVVLRGSKWLSALPTGRCPDPTAGALVRASLGHRLEPRDAPWVGRSIATSHKGYEKGYGKAVSRIRRSRPL